MSTYDLDELLKLWEFGKISEQQAIGQMMVHLQRQEKRIEQLRTAVRKLSGSDLHLEEVTAPQNQV